ncbi:rRNA maturation RNase YbeY [Candidatus Shapirobacteria bacterium]|nr:rRNA maturation RNase YbeY [Candidatus Shapirobacteria bacterium]
MAPMIEIGISSRSYYSFDKKLLRERIKKFFRERGVGEVEVSVAVVGERKMRQLNRDFRDKDLASDVLAFPQNERPIEGGLLLLGDIVVCYPRAQKEALYFQETIDEAIWDFVEHGLGRIMEGDN